MALNRIVFYSYTFKRKDTRRQNTVTGGYKQRKACMKVKLKDFHDHVSMLSRKVEGGRRAAILCQRQRSLAELSCSHAGRGLILRLSQSQLVGMRSSVLCVQPHSSHDQACATWGSGSVGTAHSRSNGVLTVCRVKCPGSFVGASPSRRLVCTGVPTRCAARQTPDLPSHKRMSVVISLAFP
jgi:hypothetical protein